MPKPQLREVRHERKAVGLAVLRTPISGKVRFELVNTRREFWNLVVEVFLGKP